MIRGERGFNKKISHLDMSTMKTILSILLFYITYFCQSATCTFIGDNVPWNVAANWSCGILPQAGDYIIIPLGKKVNITSDVILNPGPATYIVSNGTID